MPCLCDVPVLESDECYWPCLQLIAVFEEQEPPCTTESPGGNPAGRQSPDALDTEVAAQLAAFKPVGGEIEVTPSALKLGMCAAGDALATWVKVCHLTVMLFLHDFYPRIFFLKKSCLSLSELLFKTLFFIASAALQLS